MADERGRSPETLPVAVALVCLAGIGLFVPDARLACGLSASLLVVLAAALAARRRARTETAGDPGEEPVRPAAILAVLEAMPEPAFLVDGGLSFISANSAARDTFGPVREGDPVALRFRAPDLLAAAEEAVLSGERREADYVERPPEDRSFGLDILPLELPEGRSLLVLRFRDRTAERRIERMRVDFVANASHELRTPLASLIGFIETLQGAARDDAVARTRFLAIMRDQAGRMSRLIDDLLSLSRIETKRRLGPDDRADLVSVLHQVAGEMEPLAHETGVELAVETGGLGRAEVAGDADELTRVFANLVENACRYAREGERVVLGLSGGEGAVEAFVQDFGPGIDPSHIPRLTERFYRAGAETFPGGTGLGLSIVRNILLRHGTRLTIRSAIGQGSTFSARFRLSAESQARSAA